MSDKNSLRCYYRELRAKLSDAERVADSRAIANYLMHYMPWHEFTTVHVYLASQILLEVDSQALLTYLWQFQSHIRTVTNIITPDKKIICSEITANSALEKTVLGIVEPINEALISAAEIDCMIVPLLACDFYGARLGYGKGFYDQLLSQCRPDMLRLGVSFFPPQLQPLPCEPHDQRIDGLVTPNQMFWF